MYLKGNRVCAGIWERAGLDQKQGLMRAKKMRPKPTNSFTKATSLPGSNLSVVGGLDRGAGNAAEVATGKEPVVTGHLARLVVNVGKAPVVDHNRRQRILEVLPMCVCVCVCL